MPTILTVCTGNICRSPLAETLLRAHLGELVRVHSAGTHALVGHAMTPEAQHLALEFGAQSADVDGHAARYLQDPLMSDSDLILTMTREHRRESVQLVPRRLHQIFTVREFARLSEGLSSQEVREIAHAAGPGARTRLGAAVLAISERRSIMPNPSADEDDVIDPYRESEQVYRDSAAQMIPALAEVERIVRSALA
ncbi:low molecular weight phosphatase family protein [Microbacterium sp. SD291]|nr:low molecular weight phosphatase family protein [Microbacterium sp. SD291]